MVAATMNTVFQNGWYSSGSKEKWKVRVSEQAAMYRQRRMAASCNRYMVRLAGATCTYGVYVLRFDQV